MLTGDVAESRAHYDRALALYDPAEHRPLATRFGQDIRVAILSYRSWALWLLGYPEAALADADYALYDAREIGQAATLMFALANSTFVHLFSRNYAAVKARADELVALADEKGALFFKVGGMFFQGCVLAVTATNLDAVHTITSVITAFRSTGTTFGMPFGLSYLARAYAQLGQFDDAWRCIGEAMTAVQTTKETWFEAEVHRVAGEVALKSPEPMRRKRKRISNVRSRLRGRSGRSPGNCARRFAWRGCGAIATNRTRPAIFSLRSMAGSPKASTRSI